jgi:hypothetical protein
VHAIRIGFNPPEMTNKGKAPAGKGKAPAGKGSSGKRKNNFDDDKTGKRKNRGVVQFFEDEAADVDSDDSEFSDFSDGTFSQFLNLLISLEMLGFRTHFVLSFNFSCHFRISFFHR